MNNELQSFSKLFQDRLFRIPDYQRGYAWRKEQLVDFWDDLLNLQADRFHYTGLLSLKEVSHSDHEAWQRDDWLQQIDFKLFHVVDGQQRLTTFSILIYEIVAFVQALPENQSKADDEIIIGIEPLNKIKERYIFRQHPQGIITTYLFGYETDNPSAKYLKHKVFNVHGGGDITETYYTKNLEFAKSFFAEAVKNLFESSGIEGIQQLYQKLTKNLRFNLHEIQDEYDVFVAFETMNNRGKRLTNLELLKNRLIYLTTLFDDNQLDPMSKDQLREDINDVWKELYYQLGRNQNAPLSDDDFLRAHWITYFEYTRKKRNAYVSFLLDDKFSAKNVFEKHADIQLVESSEFISDYDPDEDEDQQDAQLVDNTLLVSKLKPIEIKNYVSSLQSLSKYWYYSFFPNDTESPLTNDEQIWIDKLNRIGIGYFRPLVVATLATENRTTSAERVALLKVIERFIFVTFRIGRFQASYQSSVYYRRSREVLNNNVSLASVVIELNAKIEANMVEAITTFVVRTNRRFETGEGFYGWGYLRYFLYEYEYAKSIHNNLPTKLDWNLFTQRENDKVTIEHILPQTPTEQYWRDTFQIFTDEEIKQLSGSLGNLLPLSQSINSSLQNDSFTDKKAPSRNGRRGYIDGSHSEIEVAKETDWTAQNIQKRGMKLLAFMEERWQIVIPEDKKLELLHISFVNGG